MIRKLFLCLAVLFSPALFADEATQEPFPEVIIKTAQGDITLKLNREKAPVTVDNFLSYVDSGHYNGTIFHRVIPGFMIQGGGMLPDMTQKATGDPIINESKNKLHNVRGSIAMARLNDPDSATAQFFINHRTNLALDWGPTKAGYTVFGEVTDGMKIVDFIATAPTGRVGGHGDVPLEAIIITEIVRK